MTTPKNHLRRIAREDANMPEAIRNVLSPPTQAPVCLYFERNGEDKCHGHFTGEHVSACPLFGQGRRKNP